MQYLSDEIVSEILSLLPVKDLTSCSSVCQWMHTLCDDQYLWKRLVLRDFSSSYSLIVPENGNYKGYWRSLNTSYLKTQERLADLSYSCDEAARDGDLLALQLLHKQEHLWGIYVCDIAARGGHLNILKYAHEHGCSWNKWTCGNAIHGGSVECLKYLHEHGCPWDRYTCNSFISEVTQGQLECLKYSLKHDCPMSPMFIGSSVFKSLFD